VLTPELVLGPKQEEDAFWMGTVEAEKVNDVESVNRKLASFRTPMQYPTHQCKIKYRRFLTV